MPRSRQTYRIGQRISPVGIDRHKPALKHQHGYKPSRVWHLRRRIRWGGVWGYG
jgi:hypothetical protein